MHMCTQWLHRLSVPLSEIANAMMCITYQYIVSNISGCRLRELLHQCVEGDKRTRSLEQSMLQIRELKSSLIAWLLSITCALCLSPQENTMQMEAVSPQQFFRAVCLSNKGFDSWLNVRSKRSKVCAVMLYTSSRQ